MIRNHQILLLSLLLSSLFSCGEDDEGRRRAGATPIDEEAVYTRHLGGITVATDRVYGMVIGVDDSQQGLPRYGDITDIKQDKSETPYTEDGRLDAEERADIVRLVGETKATSGLQISDWCLRLDEAYRDISGTEELLAELAAPPISLSGELTTPELDARSNFLTMSGRTDLDFSDVVIIDIGSRLTTFAATPDARADSVTVVPLDVGSRSLLDDIDALLEFDVDNAFHRQRMVDEVNELLQVKMRLLLRRPAFERQRNYVLMGGLVYKVGQVLQLPIERYGQTPFATNRRTDNMLRFQQMILQDDPDLSISIPYTRPELFTSHRMLDIILDEVGADGTIYFFERENNLPGFILSQTTLSD